MAVKKDKTVKSIESTIWESCNKLRSNMTATNYMYFVMGLIFLKFAFMKFEKRRQELLSGDDAPFVDTPSFYAEKNVFYIEPEARWDFIVKNSKQTNIGTLIDKAFERLEAKNPQLKGALPIGTYGSSGLELAKFSALISEIDKIKEDKDHPMQDLIGRIYQYFLNQFAVKTADEKGEFYTPDDLVWLITELIEPYSGKVYDPCCGSGGMFIQSYKFVEAHQGNIDQVSVYGQESVSDTWKLAKMNLAIRGIPCNLGDKNADTFLSDLHPDLKADFIIANPPFNSKDWRASNALLNDYRWKGYGVPPVSNANYAWILHMLSKLSLNGVAGFLLANGALGDSDTLEIRKNLIKSNNVEAIIICPREMFFYTDISVTLWIMRKHKHPVKAFRDGKETQLRDRSDEVLFIDLRRIETNKVSEAKKKKEFNEGNIQFVKNIYESWISPDWMNLYHDVPELCRSVKVYDSQLTDEEKAAGVPTIESQGWSLVPSKYIEFVDHDLEIDFPKEMKRIQGEMRELLKEEKASQKQLEDAFRGIGYAID